MTSTTARHGKQPQVLPHNSSLQKGQHIFAQRSPCLHLVQYFIGQGGEDHGFGNRLYALWLQTHLAATCVTVRVAPTKASGDVRLSQLESEPKSQPRSPKP